MLDGVPEPTDDAPAASTAKHRPDRLDQRDVSASATETRRGAGGYRTVAKEGRRLFRRRLTAESGVRVLERVTGFEPCKRLCRPVPSHSATPAAVRIFHRRRPTPTDWFSVIANPTQLGGYGVGMQTLLAADPALLGGPGQSSRQIVRTAHRVRVDGADRPGARGARGKKRRAAHPGHRGNASALILIVSKVRLLRRPQSRHGRGGPVPGRRPNRPRASAFSAPD